MKHHTHSEEQENRSQSPNSPHLSKASEQLKLCQSLIIETWEKRVRDQVKAAQEKTSRTLVNTLSVFLDELVTFVKLAETSDTGISPEQGMSRIHGGERAKFAGYFLPQLLKEFSILREVIVEILLKRGVLTNEVHLLIDSAIDYVISLAATEFTKVQNNQLESALNRAELSNQDLEHFAAIAAHDLKSPLATITGYLDLISEETESIGKEASESIELAQKAAERMRNLIDRLLEYAKLSKVERPFQVVDSEHVVDGALQNLSDIITRTNAVITKDPLPKVMGDSILLTQLFQNLISNSIKFRGEKTPAIHISAENNDGRWLFCLKDNGIGFDPKNKEEIFALYKKLHGEYQGSGIGLATCRKVVELHGGRIWADSTPGLGSVFYFTLLQTSQNEVNFH